MTLALGILLAVAAAAYVALPFLRSATADPIARPQSPTTRERWERQKVDAYAAIKEAEFDLRMGKLSDDDFAAQREKYGKQALEAIEALDSAQSTGRAISGRKPGRIAYCPGCGHTVPPRANFCQACGRSLVEAVA
jgi:hypothetical protein